MHWSTSESQVALEDGARIRVLVESDDLVGEGEDRIDFVVGFAAHGVLLVDFAHFSEVASQASKLRLVAALRRLGLVSKCFKLR